MMNKKIYLKPESEVIFVGLAERVAVGVGSNYDGDNFVREETIEQSDDLWGSDYEN